MVTNGLKPSNFKEWLWSAKVLTTIVWILFPWGYTILLVIVASNPIPTDFFTRTLAPTVVNTSDLGFLNILGLSHLMDTLGLSQFYIIIPPVAFMIVLLVFSVIPAIYPTEYFFKNRSSANVVIEYQYIRRILYASLIVVIISIIAVNILNSYIDYILGLPGYDYYSYKILFDVSTLLYGLVFLLPAAAFFILVKLMLEHSRKRFRFYYAKTCFEIINEKKREADKTEYLSLGLDWYKKFVKRVTKSEIDVETIYSKIVSLSPLSNSILLDTIIESFHSGDEMKPMRHMLALLSCWKEGGGTLVKESLRTKIKESSDLLIPITTVIITIIATFFLKAPSQGGS